MILIFNNVFLKLKLVVIDLLKSNTASMLSSCLHRASIVSKHFFIVSTDAHNYKNIGNVRYGPLSQQAGMPP